MMLQLNIKKPVKEVLSSLCKTFDMPDTGACYLWIPTGIQRIIEKYNGRPVSGSLESDTVIGSFLNFKMLPLFFIVTMLHFTCSCVLQRSRIGRFVKRHQVGGDFGKPNLNVYTL